MNPATLSRPWRFTAQLCGIDAHDRLRADPEPQPCHIQPIEWHVGVRLRCQGCQQVFAFTASEQQRWYEALRFWPDSVPIACPTCRRTTRSIRALHAQLSTVLAVPAKDIDDHNQIVAIAAGLHDNGAPIGRRLAQRIRMAAKRSDHPAARRLLELLKNC